MKRQDEFEQIALPHLGSLLRVARRLTLESAAAEDLVQDTMLLSWRGFHQFQRGTNARAWLFRILFNCFYGQARKSQKIQAVDLAQMRGAMRPALEEAVEIEEALRGLAEEQRTVLMLGVVEGFTCREMAEILNVPIGTVMSRLSRARQSLRDRLAPLTGKAHAL